MTKIYLLLIMLIFLSGCTSLPTKEEMLEQTKHYSLPLKEDKNLARIFFVRPSAIGGLIRFNVFLNDKEKSSEMGWTRGEQHIYFYVSPGKHTFFSEAENWAEIVVLAKAGEDIFIMQEPEMGIIMARNNLQRVNSLDGKYYLMKTKLGEIIKTKK